MAALTPNQLVVVWREGVSDAAVLYSLRNVTTGDTADCSREFSVVKRAVLLGVTVAGTITATVSGANVVTIPAGVTNDAAYLLAYGVMA